jgi:hypothetical protein
LLANRRLQSIFLAAQFHELWGRQELFV